MSDKMLVGVQGAEEAYSEKAAKLFFKGKNFQLQFYRTFYDVIDAIRQDEILYGILPIENSIIGSIAHTYDLLIDSNEEICGEVMVNIDHALLTVEDITFDKIKKVYSHPAAIDQCDLFLRQLKNAEIYPEFNTAGAAKKLAESKEQTTAVIASRSTADFYSLQIIKENISDYPENQTRFVILKKKTDEPEECYEYNRYKTSIVFDTFHKPGTLYEVLEIFSRYQINMSHLESRPNKTNPWKYRFLVDIIGNFYQNDIREALLKVEQKAGNIKVLGTYPTWDAVKSKMGSENISQLKEDTSGYPYYSRKKKKEDTIIPFTNHTIGSKDFTVIAGPCSIEGRLQMMETAKFVKRLGGNILRGGAFKPRTSPYDFQGLGKEGLELLKEAGEMTGLPVVTECVNVEDVELVAAYVDIIQIGARNMQNFALLREVGHVKKPVLLKRGMMATVKEFLLSAEYILANGNDQVILCERGIRTFETATRNTLDLSAIPIIKKESHLPVIVDPSHGTGIRELILPMSKAAFAVGADGIMVETHFSPNTALCDGAQSLDPLSFEKLIKELNDFISPLLLS